MSNRDRVLLIIGDIRAAFGAISLLLLFYPVENFRHWLRVIFERFSELLAIFYGLFPFDVPAQAHSPLTVIAVFSGLVSLGIYTDLDGNLVQKVGRSEFGRKAGNFFRLLLHFLIQALFPNTNFQLFLAKGVEFTVLAVPIILGTLLLITVPSVLPEHINTVTQLVELIRHWYENHRRKLYLGIRARLKIIIEWFQRLVIHRFCKKSRRIRWPGPKPLGGSMTEVRYAMQAM